MSSSGLGDRNLSAYSKSDREKKRSKMIEVKERSLPSACGSESAFQAEPDDQNHGKAAKHVIAHALEHAGMLCHELGQEGKEIIH